MKKSSRTSHSVTRRQALRHMGALGLGSLIAPQLLGSSLIRSQRPNIIFMMTDDHATQAMSCYGSNINQTPNLDRIGSEGIRFDNSYVTNSLCAPSRATLMTGKYSHKNGVKNNVYGDQPPFDGSQQTVQKILRDQGYQTAMIGKWHLGNYRGSDPTGFDFWSILSERAGQGTYFDPEFEEMGEIIQRQGYTTDIITDLTMDTIANRLSGSDPFFVMMHHKAPHRGWRPDKEHADMYDGYDIPEPETFYDDYDNRASAAIEAVMRIANMPDYSAPDDMTRREAKQWKYQQYIKDYLGTIASVDDNTGRLLDFLDEQGLARDTLVIYSSDNGMFLGEHGWFDKRFMYEQSLRVPLVARYPRAIPPGTVSKEMVLNLDYAQTFLDYAGISAPSDMQGRSLKPLMDGNTDVNWRDSIYYHYYEYGGPHYVRPHYGVRTQRYKLIYYYEFSSGSNDFPPEWELFDLEEDPHEMYSVYGEAEYTEVQASLKKELKRLRRVYDDDSGGDFDVPTAIDEYETVKNFKLNQNYPNPFNPSTKIEVELQQASNVVLKVYDTSGNEISTLCSKQLSAGSHTFTFNGSELSSGVYYYRMQTRGITQVRKMMLLK